eukprot:gnl/TRDRNA2_/TRDRNA2_75013_c1_seq1.p1 gnl/TRDRNA2_/TRDRNA2_75013_c1~~gnl/TRDRNA2_/TRDRNA2_75013_c1_seq1.p1  ORF type:complete len:438 (+),score=50.85 gnl/TRDRNA2_/TRDRNA2_75013_c1_seq1:2-1315(+)
MLIIAAAWVWCLTFMLWLTSQWRMRNAHLAAFFCQQLAWNVISSTQAGLVPDLVPVGRRGFAGGASAANVLVGALVAFFCIDVLSDWDYHFVYAVMSGVTVACCLLVCMFAREDPSLDRPLDSSPAIVGTSGSGAYLRQMIELYSFDCRAYHDYFALLVTKTLYCAAVVVKGFLLFFMQDTFPAGEPAKSKAMVSRLSMAAEVSAAMAALLTMLLLDREKRPEARPPLMSPSPCSSTGSASAETPPRKPLSGKAVCLGTLWMCVFWFGPLTLGAKVQAGLAAGLWTPAEALVGWSFPMVCGTALWGIGQGVYLAGDQALSFALLPDPDQASRFLGFASICASIGASLGGCISGALLSFFGAGANEGYRYPGYASIFLFASILSVCIAVLASRIRLPERNSSEKQCGNDNQTLLSDIEMTLRSDNSAKSSPLGKSYPG